MWEYLVIGGLALLLAVHSLLEIHYFLRAGLAVFLARFFRSRVSIFDTTTYSSVCLSTDVDMLLLHMNNARYLREVDFARLDFYERSGLLKAILCRSGSVFQGGSSIRYRRFIRPFSRYDITSKVIYWEKDSIYMEHRFVTPGDGFVRAVVLCKQRVVGVGVEEVMGGLVAGGKGGLEAGPPPPATPAPAPPPGLDREQCHQQQRA